MELQISKILIQTPEQRPCEPEWGKVSQSEPEGIGKSESDSDIVREAVKMVFLGIIPKPLDPPLPR